MHVFGCENELGPVGHLGTYRTQDGKPGEQVGIDLDEPHAVLIVGKRGSGTSDTLGVLSEELARVDGIAPIVIDPVGVFRTPVDGSFPVKVVSPTVQADSIDPCAWCVMLRLDPEKAVGGLVWQAASESTTLTAMRAFVTEASASKTVRRVAANHLRLADAWNVFDDCSSIASLLTDEVTVIDCSELHPIPMNAVCRAIAGECYRARVTGRTDQFPWLLLNEAHTFFDGIAAPALRRLLTRGRQPGVSLLTATQRPESLPAVAFSESDITLMHRLTARNGCEVMQTTRPTYMDESIADRMPTHPKDVLCIDDATERAHDIRVRERKTIHWKTRPRVSKR
jgi:hypothetical protein